MGLVAAGAVRTSAVSDDSLSDSLIGERFLGEGLHRDRLIPTANSGPPGDDVQTGSSLRREGRVVYVGDISINEFDSPMPSDPSEELRFDTPRPGTRERLRRKRTLRAKLKRVVDAVSATLFPAAHAANYELQPADIASAHLFLEVTASGERRAGMTAAPHPDSLSATAPDWHFAGHSTRDGKGILLRPVGPGCEVTNYRYEILLSVIEMDDDGAEFALTAHHVDTGIISFAAFGRLLRSDVLTAEAPGWCEAKARIKRRSVFFP